MLAGQRILVVEDEMLVLMAIDVNLNGTRSYPVARSLVERGIRFAFSTGYGEQGVEGFGGCPVLNKPYSATQFGAIIAELMAPPPLAPVAG